jgi:hypothetical protein
MVEVVVIAPVVTVIPTVIPSVIPSVEDGTRGFLLLLFDQQQLSAI